MLWIQSSILYDNRVLFEKKHTKQKLKCNYLAYVHEIQSFYFARNFLPIIIITLTSRLSVFDRCIVWKRLQIITNYVWDVTTCTCTVNLLWLFLLLISNGCLSVLYTTDFIYAKKGNLQFQLSGYEKQQDAIRKSKRFARMRWVQDDIHYS